MTQRAEELKISKNTTHCHTEDLKNLFTQAGMAVRSAPIEVRGRKAGPRMKFTRPYWEEIQPISVRYSKMDAEDSQVMMSATVFTIPHPETGFFTPLERIEWGMGTVPHRLLSKIWDLACYRWLDGRSLIDEPRQSMKFAGGVPKMPSLSIRVAVRTFAPKQAKSTLESRIKRAWSYYGRGGVLGVYKGQHIAWKWQEHLVDARQKYEKEVERTDKWAEKLRKYGVEPPPYTTFADYLRELADNIERDDISWYEGDRK